MSESAAALSGRLDVVSRGHRTVNLPFRIESARTASRTAVLCIISARQSLRSSPVRSSLSASIKPQNREIARERSKSPEQLSTPAVSQHREFHNRTISPLSCSLDLQSPYFSHYRPTNLSITHLIIIFYASKNTNCLLNYGERALNDSDMLNREKVEFLQAIIMIRGAHSSSANCCCDDLSSPGRFCSILIRQ